MLIVCRLIFNAAISILYQLRMRIRMLNSKTIQKYNSKKVFFSFIANWTSPEAPIKGPMCGFFNEGTTDLFKCACAVPLAQRDLVKTINKAQLYDKIC